MTPSPRRAVLDTVVFVQALISGRGPSAACIDRLKSGQFVLLLSAPLIAELRDVPLRPELTRRYPHLTPERVDAFVREVQGLAVVVNAPPRMLTLPRDPTDEPLIDLAAAGGAEFLVTWNERHLTYLMKGDTPEGKEFRSCFPNLQIISPPEFLSRLARSSHS